MQPEAEVEATAPPEAAAPPEADADADADAELAESSTPRMYQLYVLERALLGNTIAFMPTGSGKTLVAALLAKHHLRLGGRVAFVAPTKVLVDQQRAYLAACVPGTVVAITGESTRRDWAHELSGVDVLVVTPELLRHALERRLLLSSAFSLLILDECHNAIGRNPMAIVCELVRSSGCSPRILGLTASPIKCKRGQIAAKIAELEASTGCALVSPPEALVAEFLESHPSPAVTLLRFGAADSAPFGIRATDLLCVMHAAASHLRAVGRVLLPHTAAHSLLHSYLRLRHCAFVLSLYRLGNTLQLRPHLIEEFSALNLPEQANMAEGVLLEELQGALSQVMAIAEECGLVCALHSLRELLNPTSAYMLSTGVAAEEPRDRGARKRPLEQSDAHLLDIDVQRLSEMSDELLAGPFAGRAVLTDFRRAGVCSLLDCLVALASAFAPALLAEAGSNFAARGSRSGDTSAQSVAARELVTQLFALLVSGRELSHALGEDGFVDLLPGTPLPSIAAMYAPVGIACDCILDLLKLLPIPLQCATDEDVLTADNAPLFADHDLDPFSALRGFYERRDDRREAYPLVSFKVRALIGYLSAAAPASEGDWACVVFCKMRLAAISMDFLFRMLSRQRVRDNPCARIRSQSVVGQNKQRDQIRTLVEFKAGRFNVLFATDVVEEGLDVRTCQLVVNFDIPSTLKSLIQRRGRARAVNSTMVMLVPLSIEGNCIINDLALLHRQEAELEQHFRENMSELVEEQTQEGEGVDEGAGAEASKESQLPVYEVASTGAFVDVRSSVQMLLHYCQQLPHDKYFVPQPIYWFDRTGVSFRCSVLLPVTAPAQCRCAMSPFVRTKDLAKGLVSLECVKNLHFFGELDDSLLNVDRKKPQAPPQKLDLPRVEVPSGQPEEESDCEADADGPAPRTRTKDMGLAIELQSVPQMLSFVCDEDATGFGVMYLYCATVRANSREEMDVLTSCLGCARRLDAFNHFAFALPSPVPAEALGEPLAFSLRGHHLLAAGLRSLGCRRFREDELLQIQRFHRAVLCWEGAPLEAVVRAEDWSASSNGLVYLVLPLHRAPELLDSSARAFAPPDRWLQFLAASAEDAQRLTSSFVRLKGLQEGEGRAQAFRGALSADALLGMCFATSTHAMYVGVPSAARVTLNSAMDPQDERQSPPTFLEHYLDQGMGDPALLRALAADPYHSLVCGLPVNGKLSGVPWLASVTASARRYDSTRPHNHAHPVYLVPELCMCLGSARCYDIGLAAPCLLWRVQSYFSAVDLSEHLQSLWLDWAEDSGEAGGDGLAVPSLTQLLQAATPCMCFELFDSERLEFLGDSLLKFVVSTELYELYPEKHEGALTTLRSAFISNEHLTSMVCKLDLVKFLRVIPVLSGRQVLNFCPPGQKAAPGKSSLWNEIVVNPIDRVDLPRGRRSRTCATRLGHFKAAVAPKTLADFAEALIGAFYLHGGVDAARKAVKALGCWPRRSIPQALLATAALAAPSKTVLGCHIPDRYPPFLTRLALGNIDHFRKDPGPAQIAEASKILESKAQVTLIDQMERCMGYRFKDLDLLDEALTHCSVHHKKNNQRLEYLGDAILDFAVVTLVWEHVPGASQGDLNNLKSSAVNNSNLGKKALELGLQRFLSSMSSHLISEFKDIQVFLDSINEQPHSRPELSKIDISFVDVGCVNALADLLEAIVGAIFLDSGQSLEAVRDVVKKINLLPQLSLTR